MAALLAEHDDFISFPTLNSVDAARVRAYAFKTSGCPEWQNGILAVDGSLFNLYQRPGLFGDAFYKPWCIPPFKKPIGGALTPEQKEFNTVLSKIRVWVEHTFAALKGRFQSL
ncbi:hypothetical protein BDR06DRAFT_1011289 [Suillus hirtellus]|nr:hypothetical protein BDR06DRAFT_1011289 [Suillus hirtellus]